MKKKFAALGMIFFAFATAAVFSACSSGRRSLAGDIELTYSNLNAARQYGLAELGLKIDVEKNINVYDADQLNVTACVKDGAGNTYNVPMFYYEEYARRLVGGREELYSVGEGQFRMRFTPRSAGDYSLYVNIVKSGVVSRYPADGTIDFTVKAGTRDAFLSVASDGRSLQYDNGRPYVGIGNNFCGWEWAGVDNGGGTYDYDRWFSQLAYEGANMTQFDFCEGDQLEWTAEEGELEWSDGYGGLGVYNQKMAFKTDYKVNLADGLGLFYRLTLFHWEDFDTETDGFPDWGWNRNPYNRRNGGPVSDVGEFFKNDGAKRAVKNYLRYVVARWGYSPTLMMYELFNEVDAPDMAWGSGNGYSSCLSDIRAWHNEMALYLKSTDVNNHLVTTSFANAYYGGEMWSLDSIDVTTFHRYTMYNGGGNEAPFETVKSLKSLIASRLASTGKPTVPGEFAISPGGDVQREYDHAGVAFHNALYASVLSGGLGTAMSWNWGSYVDEYDLYSHYRAAGVLFKGADLVNAVPFDNLSAPAANGTVWYMGMRKEGRAYLWIKDSMHDYNYVSKGYSPVPMPASSLTVTGMPAGDYMLEYIDPYTGEIFPEGSAHAGTDGKLVINYPAFTRDIAVKIIHGDVYYTSYNMYSGNDDNGFVPHSSYTLQNTDTVTLYANGYDIGGTSDSGRYAYLTVKGDFVYTARLDRTNYSANGAKAGVMVRDSLASAARMTFVGCYNNGAFLALNRKTAGLPAAFANYGSASLGTYLRVQRKGSVLTTFVSEDGTNFVKLSEETFNNLPDELYVGVMAANKNTLGYNKAVFNHVILNK